MPWGADKPFLNKLAIRRWKARFPYWPPPGASPVTPIEPWGKQFFVYNAPPGTELRGDPRAPPLDDVRPAWMQDEDAASMLLDNEDLSVLGGRPEVRSLAARRASGASTKPGPETLLCATDYRQRPMAFLRHEEWQALLAQLPSIREELQKCQAAIDELDEKGEHMRDYLLRRKYVLDKYGERRIGNMGYGRSFGRSWFTGKVGPRARERKVRLSTAELAKHSADAVE
eukprot:TRINITY_DN68621_c0_g1_i1.p1 TRINITY_DN68621_c0_g1~~TRINITY_DN68621_c0_g1_i1.p1  ORF type:complete len:228 (+),score=45.54 TRINITY_DN68621_c0_g1_i1:51-734(+)